MTNFYVGHSSSSSKISKGSVNSLKHEFISDTVICLRPSGILRTLSHNSSLLMQHSITVNASFLSSAFSIKPLRRSKTAASFSERGLFFTINQVLPSVCRNLMSFSSESGISLIQHHNRRNVTLLHNTGFNVIIKPNAGFIAAAVPFRLKKDNVCSSFPAVFFYEPYFMTVAVEHCFTIHKLLLRTCGDEMCSIF